MRMKIKNKSLLTFKFRTLIARRWVLARKGRSEKHKRKAHYPPCETSNERGCKPGVYVVGVKREWISADWLRKRDDGGEARGAAKMTKNGNAARKLGGKEGGGEGYYDREMILDKWSNKIFSERASELAGRKSSWETGDAARELWCNGVFVEKQTGSVGKICGAGINRVFAPRSE